MKECSKSIFRRLHNPNFVRYYFKGDGIDIGGKPDPLSLYAELFPNIRKVRTWDLEDGDAQKMAGVEDDSLDFVHSSHCLEHMSDPAEALQNWFRILKPGGYLVVTVPDEDLYEQGEFPSTYNSDHKWSFTMWKCKSWSKNSINLIDLLKELGAEADIRRLEIIDHVYRYDLPRYDQTLTPVSESSIEFVVRKRSKAELASGGLAPSTAQPGRELRIHLNQYRRDRASLREYNRDSPPFADDSEI